jgi:hypothetical protein
MYTKLEFDVLARVSLMLHPTAEERVNRRAACTAGVVCIALAWGIRLMTADPWARYGCYEADRVGQSMLSFAYFLAIPSVLGVLLFFPFCLYALSFTGLYRMSGRKCSREYDLHALLEWMAEYFGNLAEFVFSPASVTFLGAFVVTGGLMVGLLLIDLYRLYLCEFFDTHYWILGPSLISAVVVLVLADIMRRTGRRVAFPPDYKFTKRGVWVQVKDNLAIVGITEMYQSRQPTLRRRLCPAWLV